MVGTNTYVVAMLDAYHLSHILKALRFHYYFSEKYFNYCKDCYLNNVCVTSYQHAVPRVLVFVFGEMTVLRHHSPIPKTSSSYINWYLWKP